DLLHWSAVDGNSRHQTLRGAIQWSYDLLTGTEQAVFRRLGVFAGGCTLEAAQAVCGEPPNHSQPVNFLDQLSVLVDQSLVQQGTAADGEARFTMLESLRTFAVEQLEMSGETARIRRRHADYYLRWAEQTLPWLQYPDQRVMDELDSEHENCRAALTWSLADQANDDPGLQLALTLYPYWHMRGHLSEGRHWLLAAIERSTDQASVLMARAQACVGELARLQDDYALAALWAKAGWSLGQSLHDPAAIALALVPLAWADFRHNNLTEAYQQ